MSKHHPSFNLALGAIWTAGYKPTYQERQALLHHFCNDDKMDHPDVVVAKAIAALERYGYPIAAIPTGLRLLEKHANIVPLSGPPSPGHAVIVTGNPFFSKTDRCFLTGEIGQVKRGYNISARGGFHSGYGSFGPPSNRHFVLSAGGGAIGGLNTRNFVATSQHEIVEAWDFGISPDGDTAVYFEIDTPVWRYAWSDADIIPEAETSLPTEWLAA